MKHIKNKLWAKRIRYTLYRFIKYHLLMIIVWIVFLLIIAGLVLYSTDLIEMGDSNLGYALLSISVSIFFTFILVNLFLRIPLWTEWLRIKKEVMSSFEDVFVWFFWEVSDITMSKVFSGGIENLEVSLHNQIDKIVKNSSIELKRTDDLKNGTYMRIFEHYKNEFNYFEIKYSKFLKCDTILPILKIQKILSSIILNMKIMQKGRTNEEEFLKTLEDRFIKLIREIKVLKDLGYLKIKETFPETYKIDPPKFR